MTRDEVLDQVASDLEVNGVDCESRCAASVRNMKSKPPEKAPEVERASNPELVARWRDQEGVKSMAPIELAALGNVLADAADVARLRAKLDVQEKLAEEALARVKHIEWLQRGAPMKGDGT